MKKNDRLSFLVSILLIHISSFIFSQNIKNNLQQKNINPSDSIWVLKSDSIRIIKADKQSTFSEGLTAKTSYHIVNFSKNEIVNSMFNDKTKRWESVTIRFDSIEQIDDDLLQFKLKTKEMVLLDINPFKSFAFDSPSLNSIYEFKNITKIKKSEIRDFKFFERDISNSNISTKNKNDEEYETIEIKERVKNMEFSEQWKKESYNQVVKYIQSRVIKEKCKMISRGYYDSNRIKYIGSQGFLVKFYCEFDCNQNHINQSYFWVEAYYLGFGKWDLRLIDQKLTH